VSKKVMKTYRQRKISRSKELKIALEGGKIK
jgi:hypothetical protein